MKKITLRFAAFSIAVFALSHSFAQDSTAKAEAQTDTKPTIAPAKAETQAASNQEIAKKLSNPVSHIINMPFQFNWDSGGGPNDTANHFYLQIQPVIPVMLNDDWSMVSRTIFLVEHKNNFGFGDQTGLGDTTQTFFFQTKSFQEKFGFIFGAGPVFLIPTATQNELGARQFGLGPSTIMVKEHKQWTFGLLASQTWSLVGDSDRDYVNKSFLQPFIAYHLPDAWTITATSEYTYDWHDGDQTFPVNLMLAKVIRVGKMPVSISFGGRYYFDKPTGGPDWGLRLMVTLVLPNFQ